MPDLPFPLLLKRPHKQAPVAALGASATYRWKTDGARHLSAGNSSQMEITAQRAMSRLYLKSHLKGKANAGTAWLSPLSFSTKALQIRDGLPLLIGIPSSSFRWNALPKNCQVSQSNSLNSTLGFKTGTLNKSLPSYRSETAHIHQLALRKHFKMLYLSPPAVAQQLGFPPAEAHREAAFLLSPPHYPHRISRTTQLVVPHCLPSGFSGRGTEIYRLLLTGMHRKRTTNIPKEPRGISWMTFRCI